jgi:hypothetical protein
MTTGFPITIAGREIGDAELVTMLHAASQTKDNGEFFGQFEYYDQRNPTVTLQRAEALLKKCWTLSPDVYARLDKGTPFTLSRAFTGSCSLNLILASRADTNSDQTNERSTAKGRFKSFLEDLAVTSTLFAEDP